MARAAAGFPPGGTPDIYGRVLSQELSAIWKQPVVVENKTGAPDTIGTDFCRQGLARRVHVVLRRRCIHHHRPNLYTKNTYDPVRYIAPIVTAPAGPFVIIAHSSFPARTERQGTDGDRCETLPGFDLTAWYGFLAPARTPREIIAKINADVVAIIGQTDFQARLARDAIDPVANTPEQFAAQIKSDIAMLSLIHI